MLGTRIIYEAHGNRTKMTYDEVAARAKFNIQINFFKEIINEVNRFLPETKSFEDRYTVFWVSPSKPEEYAATGARVQVRQISYFKKDLYDRIWDECPFGALFLFKIIDFMRDFEYNWIWN